MMTEAEAKEKRCCGPKGSGYSYNSNRYCRGAECMAWRWCPSTRWEHDADGNPTKAILEDSRGYCGLAGKP